MDLSNRRARHRRSIEAREDGVDRLAERVLDDGARHGVGKRRDAILQPGQLVGDVGGQEVAPRREHLAELDEDGAEPLETQAQALAAWRRKAPAEGDDADEEANPALAKARERQLVEPEAKNRDPDDDEPGDVPHRRGGSAAGGTSRGSARRANASSFFA